MSIYNPDEQEEAGAIASGKLLVLQGYIELRRRPWFLPFLLAGMLLVVAFILDPAQPLYDHGVFSGMFLIWSGTAAAIGVLVYLVMKGLVFWSKRQKGKV